MKYAILLSTLLITSFAHADTSHHFSGLVLRTFEGSDADVACAKLKATLNTLNGQEILDGQVIVRPSEVTADHKTEFRKGVKISAQCTPVGSVNVNLGVSGAIVRTPKVTLSIDLDVDKDITFALGQFYTENNSNLEACLADMDTLHRLSSRDKVEIDGSCTIGLNYADDELTEVESDDAHLEVRIKVIRD